MLRGRGLAEGFAVMPENGAMAQSIADRQKAFKASMKQAGMVRLEAWVTKEQRRKFRDELGGDEWLRKKIDNAKPKEPRE